ncbi:tyrosine-type recombinase/integrase [Pseudobutyrivibrio sp.]|uniref:tyrosine-type recombinase/integrase n=1 Tax=Pseudobutyrivibrio sp. TaxID=2014367 RepID=UPI0025ED6F64|nr:tyrosine-type recombinase/integrase [Pseudobutyrivibrio sp.]
MQKLNKTSMISSIMLNKNILELKEQLKQVSNLQHDINSCITCGTISLADAASQIMMLKENSYQLKLKLIKEVHVTNNGAPRKIEYKETKGLWYTLLPDKHKLYGKTEEILLDKLMAYYGLTMLDFKMKTVFEQALEHKGKTEAVSDETLYHLKSSFARFIDEKLANSDIRSITCDMLSEYTLKMLRKAQWVDEQGVAHKVKKKAYLEYKSVLNLIFQYALLKDYIKTNPLSKFSNKVFYKECDCGKAQSSEKIFSDEEIKHIKERLRSKFNQKKYKGYFINGYAILLAIETGMRVGELPSLKWTDIKGNYIHIHSQQLSKRQKGGKEYYYADWTKNEKGIPMGGRKFPLTQIIKELLAELKELQVEKGIVSEYVFCHENGEWIKTDAYIACLSRLLKSLNYNITNNHAFRMSLNSNVLCAKLHLPVAKRAELLGHSVETNLKYYTFSTKDNMDDIIDLFDSNSLNEGQIPRVSPRSHQNVIIFTKKESPETLISQAF